MAQDRVSLAELQTVPEHSLILLVGPPGAGKSTFCHQVVLNSLALGRPIIFVTTEQRPAQVLSGLRERGLGQPAPEALRFVDAFSQTVGVATPERPNTIQANCMDLNSISIAITRLQERMGQKGILLAFDSLTSPYLLSGAEVVKFIRLFLSKFAAEGNSVITVIDEGCSRAEDLVAMMSIADGIIKMEIKDGSRIIDVVKHPQVEPTKIEIPMTWSPAISYHFDMSMMAQHIRMSMGMMAGIRLRTEVGDYVNVFWPNFARWSGMLWDPKRFPMMTYNSSRHLESRIDEFIHFLPWHRRLFLRLLMPNSFSRVEDMKKLMSLMQRLTEGDRRSIMEYLENASRTDEHYVRVHESDTCWGFGNVGATLGLGNLGGWAGALMGFEKEDRDWSAVETKCVGLGDPYCEVKVVPGEINELKGSLEAMDSTIVERVYDRLMDRLMEFMLHGKPLWERPRLGNEVSLHAFNHIMVLPAMASERYRMAMRLGGAMGGKEVGEGLVDAGLGEDEAVKRTLSLLEYCKVGKVSMGETIRIRENCESFMIKAKEPSCYFTTGFLNGLFSAVKSQHVREIKCIAMGDPYCEWEIL